MKEKVCEFLETKYDALSLEVIVEQMNVKTAEEIREIQSVLNELVQEQVVYFTKKNRYILYSKCPNFKKGKIDVNKKGFGFLLLENEPDVHIAGNCLNYALDGDTVLVEIINPDPAKPEGRVISILERDVKNIVGTIKNDGKSLYFSPNDDRDLIITIDNEEMADCVEGEIVVVSLSTDLGKNRYLGNVVHHIAHKDDPHADIKAIAAKYEIYDEFPQDVLEQIEKVPNEVQTLDRDGRIDLTDRTIFTIDGADTKDVDDAISIDVKDGYYILGVHIADVSYYVEENSPLDLEAYRRGTSSYLANSVIPMLPHKLSNGICSLNPDVERCALSCEMKIDNRGHIVDATIFPSIIKSRKKMTYTAVNDIIMRGEIAEGYEDYVVKLKQMQELAHILREEKVRRGYIDFDLDEAKILTNDDGVAIDVEKRVREDGEKLIEDFMIAANESVASYIFNMSLPFVYRVHDLPNAEKINTFIAICSLLGKKIVGKFDKLNPKMFQKLLKQVTDDNSDTDEILRALALRSMAKAYYSKDNIGHFGLGSKCYTHFTSPIRRYPDLMVHRLLRTYLVKNEINEQTINYWENNLDAITRQCSEREVAAVEAEREVTKMKMAEYMESHVGEEYEGIITGVQGFGFFVQLDNLVEGLVPVNSLAGDFYECDENNIALVGRGTNSRYMIGQRVYVKCVRASKEASQIDFEVVKELKLDDAPKKKELVKHGNKK